LLKFPPEQPQYLCPPNTDAAIRHFLFKYWKRPVVGWQSDQILKQANLFFGAINTDLTNLASHFTKNEKVQKLINTAKVVFTEVQFLSTTLNMISTHFNFTMRLHRLFLAITKLDFLTDMEVVRDLTPSSMPDLSCFSRCGGFRTGAASSSGLSRISSATSTTLN
jgi:hypothetical protein